MGRLVQRDRGVGFEIWAGIPLFCSVPPVRLLVEGDVGWFSRF